MNKFLLFLAFASFALLACSEEPAPTHAELCAKTPITKECLVGRWFLERVIREGSEANDPDCNRTDNVRNLTFKANGEFTFEIGNNETNGLWKLSDKGTEIMEIECRIGACADGFEKVNAKISLKNSELRVAADGFTSFSQCKLEGSSIKLVEVFGWQGAK